MLVGAPAVCKLSLDTSLAVVGVENGGQVYFLQAPTRKLAEQSPYYEAFKESGREVGVGVCTRMDVARDFIPASAP